MNLHTLQKIVMNLLYTSENSSELTIESTTVGLVITDNKSHDQDNWQEGPHYSTLCLYTCRIAILSDQGSPAELTEA